MLPPDSKRNATGPDKAILGASRPAWGACLGVWKREGMAAACRDANVSAGAARPESDVS
jgi:hypothetical protein